MQQTWPAPKTPCQLTLQTPSWLVIESALGPVTTSLLLAESGRTLFWLRSSVIDSRAACRVTSRPAGTAASAAVASTPGLVGSLTQGWQNSPNWDFTDSMPPEH